MRVELGAERFRCFKRCPFSGKVHQKFPKGSGSPVWWGAVFRRSTLTTAGLEPASWEQHLNDLARYKLSNQNNTNKSVFFIKVACALGDKSPSGSFKLKSSFFLMYLNWKLLLNTLKISPWTGCTALSRQKKKKIGVFPLMQNKKPGRDKSVSKVLSLMQDGAAVRSSLTCAYGHQVVFTTLLRSGSCKLVSIMHSIQGIFWYL